MKIDEIIYERSFDIPVDKRKKVGSLIKQIREDKKIKLAEMSEKSGVGLSDLHKIEYGNKNKINPFQLKSIAVTLGIDYKFLYKIVGFLEENDFESSVSMLTPVKTIKDFREEVFEEFLANNQKKVSETQLKRCLDILNTLAEDKLLNWLSYGDFLKTN